MIYVINFADDKYRKQQKYNSKTAYKYGADKVLEFTPNDIDLEFLQRNKEIFKLQRGYGYWLWKPYIILKTLERINNNDYLFYCDAGAYFVNNIKYLINRMESCHEDIMVFELPLIEKQWTKRDAFILMNCDTPEYTESNQILASYFIVKKNEFTIRFFKEFLSYCQDPKILTDMGNTQGQDNYLEFIEHRHDQSIFSLLCKKYKIKPHRDPSQYGIWPIKYYAPGRLFNPKKYEESYPQILVSCRKDISIQFKVKEFITRKMPIVYLCYSKFIKRRYLGNI